jgi:hypothetical protein
MAKKHYKSKLEKLIKTPSKGTFEPTLEDCKRWFNLLNRELFGNRLPQVTEIDIRWRRGTHAYYWYVFDDKDPSYYECKLAINKQYESKKFFVEVLAHEMVHHWQYVNGDPMGHGPSFFEWRDLFNKKGLNLVKAY